MYNIHTCIYSLQVKMAEIAEDWEKKNLQKREQVL